MPDDFKAREYLKRIISETYEQYGYQPIDTPVVENVDVLEGKGGGENEKLMFKVLKRGNKLSKAIGAQDWARLADMGLRFDLTVPFARFVAAHLNELPPVFKRYHIAPVWRADRPQFGRFREFVQCDVDVIGSDSMMAEADVICATATCLKRIGFGEGLTLRINNRPLAPLLLGAMGLPENLLGEGCRLVDKLDKLGIGGVCEELQKTGASGETAQNLSAFYKSTEAANSEGRIAAMREAVSGEDADALIGRIEEILDLCEGVAEIDIVFDPFLVRGMDYYTGPIFEITHPDVGFSLAGGGRYDRLVGMFCGNRDIPATGFSIGFERILVLMKERGMLPENQSGIDVVVCADGTGVSGRALIAAGETLRAKKLKVDVALTGGTVGKTMQLAQKRSAAFGVILRAGDPDNAEVRELDTRRSETMSIGAAAETIAGKLLV